MLATFVSRIVRVGDGDTIYVDIDDWPPIVGSNMPVRVRGVNCPEINSTDSRIREAAKMAKGFTMTKIAKAEKVYLNNISRGCYFRLLADVWLDGKSLGEMLLSEGHAVRWCR